MGTDSNRLRKIHDYIVHHRNEHLARVQQYLRQPSVSSTGLGIRECARLLVEYLKRLGCKEANLVETDGNPGVWGAASLGGAGRTPYSWLASIGFTVDSMNAISSSVRP